MKSSNFRSIELNSSNEHLNKKNQKKSDKKKNNKDIKRSKELDFMNGRVNKYPQDSQNSKLQKLLAPSDQTNDLKEDSKIKEKDDSSSKAIERPTTKTTKFYSRIAPSAQIEYQNFQKNDIIIQNTTKK